jgi:hypothetical protein
MTWISLAGDYRSEPDIMSKILLAKILLNNNVLFNK